MIFFPGTRRGIAMAAFEVDTLLLSHQIRIVTEKVLKRKEEHRTNEVRN